MLFEGREPIFIDLLCAVSWFGALFVVPVLCMRAIRHAGVVGRWRVASWTLLGMWVAVVLAVVLTPRWRPPNPP